ncbi:MAG TPA: protein kinase [Pseudomonadales bacterium]|nr:protein kinase [Pseudomonadales bacterium]
MPGFDSELTVRQIVPDYELLRRIGKGAYGEVWLARSKATGILRAAKIVWRHTFSDEHPFQREFEGIQHFEQISREHPSQLALFHIGRNKAEGYFYYVMELADDLGTKGDYTPHTLRADFQKGRLPAERVIEIGLALTEALGHLHRNGLVHRDVKPANVIFVNGRPKLADIGLVTDASESRSIVGTEGYLSPEGIGLPAADLFALGKVLYEAATGLDRRKFPDLPPDIRTWPDAAQVFEINEIILKACAQNLKQRYQSCEEMQADLVLLERGKSIKRKRTRQRRWALGKKAGAVVSILALIAAIIPIWFRESNHPILAKDYCERGLKIIRGNNYAQLADAYGDFKTAITLDPNSAQPYVGLLEMALREPYAMPDTVSRAAMKLKQLAPHSAAAYCAQSIVDWYDDNYPEALQNALAATQADDHYELGHTWYGYLLTQTGWPAEGRAQLQISLNIAPPKAILYGCMGGTYYAQRDFTNAFIWYRKATEMDPHHSENFKYLGRVYQVTGDYSNALSNYEKLDSLTSADGSYDTAIYSSLRAALAKGGIPGYWQQQWKLSGHDPMAWSYWKAVIQIHLGDTNAALNYLDETFKRRERQYNEGPSTVSQLLLDPEWDGLHEDPRFKHLLDEIGFAKVMPPQKNN